MTLVPLQGFIGPTNVLAAPRADVERTINWYYEETAPGTGKTESYFVPTPGTNVFVILGGSPVRCLFAQDGRCFAICGPNMYEVFASHNATYRGSVIQDGRPATISSNGHAGGQLFVTSGGHGYIYDLLANSLTEIADPDFLTPSSMGAFCDGYFLNLLANSNEWQFSALEDGTTWAALDVNVVSTTTDNILSLQVVHRDVWLLGSQTTQVWANLGDATTPFQPIPGSLLQQGIVGRFAVGVLVDTLFWMGQNAQGGRVVYRAQGYTAQRVSSHAVELALDRAPRVDDTIVWTYQDRGHSFVVFYVPAMETSYTYDAVSGQWHERAYWDLVYERWRPHVGRCHAYAFEQHLIGDRQSGAIYTLDNETWDDALPVIVP